MTTPSGLPEGSEDIPRRIRLDRMVAAERAIFDATQAVDEMPPDPLLTEAVVLLNRARGRVSDYVDAHPDQQVVPTGSETRNEYLSRKMKELADATRKASKLLPDRPITGEVVACAGIMAMANLLDEVSRALAAPPAAPEAQEPEPVLCRCETEWENCPHCGGFREALLPMPPIERTPESQEERLTDSWVCENCRYTNNSSPPLRYRVCAACGYSPVPMLPRPPFDMAPQYVPPVEPEPVAPTWQPWGTRPLDGREVLGMFSDRIESVWCIKDASWHWMDGDSGRTDPTHWMPLPPPPVAPREEGKP